MRADHPLLDTHQLLPIMLHVAAGRTHVDMAYTTSRTEAAFARPGNRHTDK